MFMFNMLLNVLINRTLNYVHLRFIFYAKNEHTVLHFKTVWFIWCSHWNSSNVESRIISAPVICVISLLLTVKSSEHKVSGSCNKTGVWVRLLLTHLSLSALVVKEVERRGSSWQSNANTGGKGSPCCKTGKAADYLGAHSHPSLPQCQLCFPEMTCSTSYQLNCLTSLLHWVCTDLPGLPDPSVPPRPRISGLWFRWPDWELPLFFLGTGPAHQGGMLNQRKFLGTFFCILSRKSEIPQGDWQITSQHMTISLKYQLLLYVISSRLNLHPLLRFCTVAVITTTI